MKRILSVLIVFVLIMTFFSGCRTNDPGTNSSSSGTENTTEKLPDITQSTEQKTPTATSVSAENVTLTYDECRCVGVSLAYYFYAIGFRPEDVSLYEKVRKTIECFYDDDKIDQVAEKWFCDEVFAREADYNVSWKAKGNDSSWKDMKKKGEIVVGADANAYPLSFLNDNGEWDGFEVDVARLVFEDLGLSVRFEKVTKDTQITALSDNTVDVLWGAFRYDSTSKAVLYSDPSVWRLENGLCYFTKKRNTYSGEADLWGMNEKMAVVKGSFASDILKGRMKNQDVTISLIDFENITDAFLALQHEDVFVAACDYLSAYAILK